MLKTRIAFSLGMFTMNFPFWSVLVPVLVPLTVTDTPGSVPTESRSEERRVGKECVIRVDLGGRRIIKKQISNKRCMPLVFVNTYIDIDRYTQYRHSTNTQ